MEINDGIHGKQREAHGQAACQRKDQHLNVLSKNNVKQDVVSVRDAQCNASQPWHVSNDTRSIDVQGSLNTDLSFPLNVYNNFVDSGTDCTANCMFAKQTQPAWHHGQQHFN